jgi:2-polyprenyl-3-methyl-5-hydroxy-6-metoxy-1,4-benzoquinol methylase
LSDNPKRTVEPQYQHVLDEMAEQGLVELGPKGSAAYRFDAKRVLFILARYKFSARMLSGMGSVLEVGCADGFALPVVLQEVKHVHGVDIDQAFIEWAEQNAKREGHNATFEVLDITRGVPAGNFDGALSLDVIEHITPAEEAAFMRNICRSLQDHGVCVIGTPNITSDTYASERSRTGHVNLKSADTLRETMRTHFHNVFMFSMNDEVVHTGFSPMAHYLFAVGVGPRTRG